MSSVGTTVKSCTSYESARAVVVTLPDHGAAEQVIRQVRVLAPSTDIIARARYHIHAPVLSAAGATLVIDEEVEVGRSLGTAVRELGPTDRTENDIPSARTGVGPGFHG